MDQTVEKRKKYAILAANASPISLVYVLNDDCCPTKRSKGLSNERDFGNKCGVGNEIFRTRVSEIEKATPEIEKADPAPKVSRIPFVCHPPHRRWGLQRLMRQGNLSEKE
jgi:hypothetical protein